MCRSNALSDPALLNISLAHNIPPWTRSREEDSRWCLEPLFVHFPKRQLFNDLLLVTGFIPVCLEGSLPVVRRSVHMSFVFSLTCCSDLLEKVGITSTDCWMMLPLSQHIDISSLGVTMAIVSTEEEDCGGTMFVLYLSEPVPPVFDKPCALQRGSKKKKSCLPRGKGERTSTWKLSSIERNMGVHLHMQTSLLWCSLLWTQELTEEQGQNWQVAVCPCTHSLSEFREVCLCSVAQPYVTRSWCKAYLDNTITKLEEAPLLHWPWRFTCILVLSLPLQPQVRSLPTGYSCILCFRTEWYTRTPERGITTSFMLCWLVWVGSRKVISFSGTWCCPLSSPACEAGVSRLKHGYFRYFIYNFFLKAIWWFHGKQKGDLRERGWGWQKCYMRKDTWGILSCRRKSVQWNEVVKLARGKGSVKSLDSDADGCCSRSSKVRLTGIFYNKPSV